jgi:hypothetical protein
MNSGDDEDEDEGGEEGEDDNDTYYANGLIFPILLHELFKAFSIVQSRAQWKDMDPDLAQSVIAQTDTMSNEPMNFRVGAELIKKIRSLLPEELVLEPENKVYMPYFEQILYSIPAEEFLNDVIANVVSEDPSDNQKAERRFEEIYAKAKEQYNKFKGDTEEEDEDDDDDDDDGDLLSRLGL